MEKNRQDRTNYSCALGDDGYCSAAPQPPDLGFLVYSNYIFSRVDVDFNEPGNEEKE